MERIVHVHESPEAAERATRRAYRAMPANERVTLTVALQRSYYAQQHDAPGRLPRILAVLERT